MKLGALGLSLSLCACAPRAVPVDAGDGATAVDDATSDGGGHADAANGNPYCANGTAAVRYPPEPHAIADDSTLPDLSFDDGRGGTVRLSQYFVPCAPSPQFLVIRELAAWSGPSQWHANHTQRVLRELGEGAQVLDLLALGRDNLPATPAELHAWTTRFAPIANQRIALDPDERFKTLFIGVRQLPIVVVVDRRTMRAIRVLIGQDQHAIDEAFAKILARAQGRPPPPHVPRAPNELTEDMLDLLRQMATLPAPPPSPTNRYADDPRAAALGERLFNDPGFSAGGVSCASCHEATRDFTDGRPVGLGVAFQRGGRNTPTVRFGAYTRWLFWDGRADSLWSQALGPVENPVEMRSTRLHTAHRIFDVYRTEYEAIFGPMPPLDDRVRFPPEGKPGDPAFDAMSEQDQVAVNRVFANFGKAIEAYERTLRFAPSALDRYVMGDTSALTPEQQAGLHHFFSNGCIQCHHGPMLTDDSFHNIGMPSGLPDGSADRGWFDAIALVRANPFNAGGIYSDAPMMREHLDRLPLQAPEQTLGMMHTPGLRGVSRTGPWGHGGRFARLEDVVMHYASEMQRMQVSPRVGVEDLHLGSFHSDTQTIRALTAFLHAL